MISLLMKKLLIAAILVSASLSAQEAFLPESRMLERPFGRKDYKLFCHPPKVFYPEVWVDCLCGNLSIEGMKADLEAISQAGFSGVQLFFGNRGGAWPGVEQIMSLSPQWEDVVRYAAEKADSLGLRFTLQNCPGWAMAGGPWITPDKAMRHLTWTRTDVSDCSDVVLPKPDAAAVDWRDYKDLMVLAFRTPSGDTGRPLETASVSPAFPPSLAPTDIEHPYMFDIKMSSCEPIRTAEFMSVQLSNHWFCYDPGIRGWMEAVYPDGSTKKIFDTEWPSSNWQDDRNLSIACDEVPPTDTYRLYIANTHGGMGLGNVNFYSSARKNNWESEAAWSLRSIMRNNDEPSQDITAYVSDVLDLTDQMSADGHLECSPPDGQWTIMRIGHVNTGKKNAPAPPEATGFECNKFSESGAESHFNGYIGKMVDGKLNGLLDGMLMDSWECETQTWTDDMESEFRRVNGYDLRPWIPALMGYVVNDPQTTSRFLRDWRATINDLVVNKFYGKMASLAHSKGLSVTYETAGGDVFPSDIMEYFKYADIPMCEFWIHDPEIFVGTLDFKPIKPTASAGRLYGKPRIAAEAFTSMQQTWDEQLSVLKDNANRNCSEGATYLIYQAYTHNPKPDILVPGTSFGDGIGTPFLRSQTWWRYMHSFNDCTARTSYMLERGKPVSDVLWYLGDEIDHKPHQEAYFPDGFKYDYCNPDILLNRLSVKDGLIVTPEGISYRLLWLADTRRLVPETAERMLELVRSGATLVGDRPEGLATLSGGDDAALRLNSALDALFGGDTGKGRVISGVTLDEALHTLDMKPDLSGGNVMWLHRNAGKADWYYVCAPKGETFKGTLSFRNSGAVEIWNPVNGEREIPQTKVVNGRTELVIDLDRAESRFVIFRHNRRQKHASSYEEISEYLVKGQWTVEFPKGWGQDSPLSVDELKPLQDFPVSDEAKAFSGTITYRSSFEWSGKHNCLLDLGKVEQIARVYVNGKVVTDLWTPPYRADITNFVKKGSNDLVIEVTNTWFNRLAYDVNLPENQRKTWTTSYPAAGSPLRASGLIGPVTVHE